MPLRYSEINSSTISRPDPWSMVTENIQKKMPIHLFPPFFSHPSISHNVLPLSFLHPIISHFALPPAKLNGSIAVMVPEGALTLPLHFCSSPSCGAAVGVTKGSLHLRGQPTSSWESRRELRAESERITGQQTCLFATKWTEKERDPCMFSGSSSKMLADVLGYALKAWTSLK